MIFCVYKLLLFDNFTFQEFFFLYALTSFQKQEFFSYEQNSKRTIWIGNKYTKRECLMFQIPVLRWNKLVWHTHETKNTNDTDQLHNNSYCEFVAFTCSRL